MSDRATDTAAMSDEAYLADRYGLASSRRQRVRLVVSTLVIAVVVTAWATWIGTATSHEPVTFQAIGFQVDGSTSVQVTFDVTMDPGTRAVCTLQALNQISGEVGLVDVTVPAATTRTQRVKGQVPTTEAAVTGLVKACAVRSSDD